MLVFLYTTDELEALGLKWLLDSHMSDIELITFDSLKKMMSACLQDKPDLLIIDMDKWDQKEDVYRRWLQSSRWLGISSERIFQTAYRGLRLRAEDVLFRPIAPEELLKSIQQMRFQIRNEKRATSYIETTHAKLSIDYSDFVLGNEKIREPILMAALLSEDLSKLSVIHSKLQEFPFSKEIQVFAFSQFILCVGNMPEDDLFRKEYHAFLENWKEEYNDPLAIIINTHWQGLDLKEMYDFTKQLTEMIFFEGYDIILAKNEQIQWLSLDPFLTPLEQRQWIEMLEKRDIQAIRKWMEHEFLEYSNPYPLPEMVRIRITSVLAQIRRFMKSYQLQDPVYENAYHETFRQIIQEPVVYRIVQTLLTFTIRLLKDRTGIIDTAPKTLIEKVRSLMESNYWNPLWNLESCAENLRINKSTLSRRFAAESEKTFRDTLHEIKINEAKRLLKETDLPLEEIAQLVGYHHRTYFNAKFKQLEKKTPKEFRMGL